MFLCKNSYLESSPLTSRVLIKTRESIRTHFSLSSQNRFVGLDSSKRRPGINSNPNPYIMISYPSTMLRHMSVRHFKCRTFDGLVRTHGNRVHIIYTVTYVFKTDRDLLCEQYKHTIRLVGGSVSHQ